MNPPTLLPAAWYITHHYALPFLLNSLAVLLLPSQTMMYLSLTHRTAYDETSTLTESEEDLESTLMQISAWTSSAFLILLGCVQINGYAMTFPVRCFLGVGVAAVVVGVSGWVAKASGFVPERLVDEGEVGKEGWRGASDGKTEAELRKVCTATCWAYMHAQKKNEGWRNEAFW